MKVLSPFSFFSFGETRDKLPGTCRWVSSSLPFESHRRRSLPCLRRRRIFYPSGKRAKTFLTFLIRERTLSLPPREEKVAALFFVSQKASFLTRWKKSFFFFFP